MRICLSFILCLTVGLILFSSARAEDDADWQRLAKWQKAIAAFEEQDQSQPPPKGAILFVGSSSIRLWDLPKSFPNRPVINRGFGGSHISDSVHFAERVILKHQPRLVVFYAGDNDIAGKKSPDKVLSDFQALVRKIHAALPKTRIAFIAIKPSLKRWDMFETQKQANALVADYCGKDERLIYIDIVRPMLGEDGKPRPELFVADGLHLSPAGYRVWTETVQPHLP
ncbi:MAG: SGNH/GDSL hydrolase family protein [Gemmataceae bacterium]